MANPAALLIDLDGVLYEGDRIVEGAAACVRWLVERRVPRLYVTNTTSRPRQAIVDRRAALGIETESERILTPLVAASRWLSENAPGVWAAFVPAATCGDLTGVELLDERAETGARSVVLGDLGDAWDYATLNRAFRLLMDEPAPVFVALGMTRYWRASDGLRIDVAAFVRALECAAGVEAVVLGKPAPAFFDTALAALGATRDTAAMIGDDIVSDVNAAQDLGMTGVLVRTGKFRASDLECHHAPDAVIDSIASLPEWYGRSSLIRSGTSR